MKKCIQIPKEFGQIAFVGEAPGEDEVRTGIPFVGPSGQYLRNLIRAAGIDIHTCPITNTVHEQPIKNIYATLPRYVLEEGKHELINDLEDWRTKGVTTLVAVGAKAMNLLTGIDSITKYRGSFLPCTLVDGLKVIPTFHTAYLLRGHGKEEPVVFSDLSKAKMFSHTTDLCHTRHHIEILRTVMDAEAVLHRFLHYDKPVGCDIECRGGLLTAFAIADATDHAYVFTKEVLRDPRVLRALGKFAKGNTKKVFHNAGFDCLHGALYYNILWNNYEDTMLMQHSVYPTFRKSLAFCASLYTNEPYWKDEGKEGKAGTLINDAFYNYNGKDACVTLDIYSALNELLDYWNTRKTYEFSLKLLNPVIYSMYRGILVNTDAVKNLYDHTTKVINILEDIKKRTIGDVNVNSREQMTELLYEQWKLPKQYSTAVKKGVKTKVLTAGKKKLKVLERLPFAVQPHLGLLIAIKNSRKLRSFCNFKIDPDGRTRTSLKIHGAYTGRMSSSRSITGSGTNLQNQPKAVRKFYVPDSGKLFVQMDLSQAEARVVAALCKDHQWLNDFDICDLHTKVACSLFNVTEAVVEANRAKYRDVAKRVAHGTHYLLGPGLLSEILNCSMNEARAHKEAYFKLRPSLYGWHTNVKNMIKKQKYLVTPYGRVIQFFGPFTDDIHREAVAAEPQSTSAEYLNNAILKIYDYNIKSWEFLLQVHDSILCMIDLDKSLLYNTIATMKKLTEVTIDVHGIPLLIPADFEVGFSWKDMVKVKSLDHIDSVWDKLQEQLH